MDQARLTFHPTTPSRRPSHQVTVSPMRPPSHPALQQLHRLDGSSSEFHNQLSSILYGEEYQQCLSNLQGDDPGWLVGYLNTVRRHVALPHSRLCYWRSLAVLMIPPVLLSGSVYANSVTYARPGRCFQPRTLFLWTFSTLIPNRSPQEVMVTYTGGPSMVKQSASNVCAYIPVIIQGGQPKYSIDDIAFPVHHH